MSLIPCALASLGLFVVVDEAEFLGGIWVELCALLSLPAPFILDQIHSDSRMFIFRGIILIYLLHPVKLNLIFNTWLDITKMQCNND